MPAHPIHTGAEDPLPKDHFTWQSPSLAIYSARQPRSQWREHAHPVHQITIALEPAHIHSAWRTGVKPRRREHIGSSVSIIPAGHPHQTLWQRRAALLHLYLEPQALAAVNVSVLDRSTYTLHPAYLVRDPFLEELGRVLHRECSTGRLPPLLAESLTTLLGTHLLRTYSSHPEDAAENVGPRTKPVSLEPLGTGVGLTPARERRIREYIEGNLSRNLSLSTLAQAASLSPSHFAALFRQSTGFTPHQYLLHRRIARAQQLLASTASPLAEVAALCGFPTQAGFTTAFRRFTSLTPARFRQAHTASG